MTRAKHFSQRRPRADGLRAAGLAACGFVLLLTAHRLEAQTTRVDLSGPFVHLGGTIGSVTGSTEAPGASHTGGGWSVGGGMTVSRWTALVANYSVFNFRDDSAPQNGTMEQTEFGLRFRVGGTSTPAIFYLEGGAAMRRADLTTSRVFPTTIPPGANATVDARGWAGWFGPGVQYYFGRKLSSEINVAWGWGSLNRIRVANQTVDAEKPANLTTLRLRAGFAATLF